MVSFQGAQQSSTSRVISPSERPLHQAETFNSHHKTKKLRLDDSLSGGLIVTHTDRFLSLIKTG